MFRILLALTLAMLFCSVASAQEPNPQCPTISITGPPGLPEPGQLVPFNVQVEPAVSQLVYKWSVSSGSVASGQGTKSIGVKFDPNGGVLTATVEIGGLPQNCPTIASETAAWGDRAPQAAKIDTYTLPISSIKDERFRAIADAIENNPTSQIYILAPAVKEIRDGIAARLDRFIHKGIDPPRITLVETAAANKFVEVWLVPPGATPPVECEECEKVKPCPTITVVGPADVTRPGSVMTFTANVPKDYRGEYRWSVSAGNIESSRTNPWIYVRVPGDTTPSSITATVELDSLPAGCPNAASETSSVAIGGDPIILDTYGRLSRNDEKARLWNVSKELAKYPKFVAFVTLRIPKKLGRAAYNRRVQTITSLFRSLRVSKDKYVFVDAGDGELSTTIYLMPSSAIPDSWKTGKYQ